MRYLSDSLKRQIAGRLMSAPRAFLFFDYDGTLTRIRALPSLALPDPSVVSALNALSRRPGVWVAIVTGRSLRDIRSLFRLKRLIYAANHGFEVQGPGFRHTYPAARLDRGSLRDAASVLGALSRDFPGTFLEDKDRTLTYHYRLLKGRSASELKRAILDTLAPWLKRGSLSIHRGKKSFEIRPSAAWNKGSAVRWLLLREAPDAEVLYVGDDQTDESAFQALRGRAVTVRVGKSRNSAAEYYVRHPGEILSWLDRMLESRRKSAERDAA